jgi:hypothetical protein
MEETAYKITWYQNAEATIAFSLPQKSQISYQTDFTVYIYFELNCTIIRKEILALNSSTNKYIIHITNSRL